MRPIATLTALLAALLLAPSDALAAGDWKWPVAGEVVTQFHNGTDPYAAGQHRGVDIAAPVGSRVVAATAGTIAYAGVVGSSGLTVAERTADGTYELSYLHLSAVAVRRGQSVAAGDALGAVGTTGRRSIEQPHLHFGVRDAADRHAYVDPLRFLAPPPAAPESPRSAPAPAPVESPVAAPPAAEPVAPALPAPAAQAPSPTVHPGPLPHGGAAHSPAHSPLHGPASLAATPQHGGLLAPVHATAPSVPSHRAGGTHAEPAAHRAGAAQRPAGTAAHGAASPHGAGPAAQSRSADARRATAGSHHGIDVGWLAACLGLIVAAALLAGPAGGRRERGSARAVFATLMRAGSRG
jgi:hypothetical protein